MSRAAPDRTTATVPHRGTLLSQPVAVVNVGLERFAVDLRACGATVTQVQWSPPAGGDARLASLLAKLGG